MLIKSPKELAIYAGNYRKKLDLTQSELGQRVGLKQQTVSDFELRPEYCQIETLFRILSALELDMKLVPKNQQSGESQWHEEW